MLTFPSRQTDKLIGALIGIARATDGNEHLISPSSTAVIVESLAALAAETGFDTAAQNAFCRRVEDEKRNMVPDCFLCACPCGKNSDYPMENLWNAEPEIRECKCRILQTLRGIAVQAHAAALLGHHDEAVDRFFYKALFAVGMDDWTEKELQPIALEAGQMDLRAGALLARAKKETGNG